MPFILLEKTFDSVGRRDVLDGAYLKRVLLLVGGLCFNAPALNGPSAIPSTLVFGSIQYFNVLY